MKKLEKIINLTTRIYELYIVLLNMELNGLNGTSDYLEKLEILKLYKEYEDKYYKELNYKNDIENLTSLKRNLNVDNTVEEHLDNIKFSIFTFDDKSNKEMIIKRRIFTKIENLIIQNMNNDELVHLCSELSKSLHINMARKSLYVGGREILILDKANILKDIILRAIESILLRYMFFSGLNKMDDISINKKYIISFINENIEEKLLSLNFKINYDFLEKTKYIGESKINQEIFEDILFEHSYDIFYLAAEEFLTLENISSEKSRVTMDNLKAIILATGVEIHEDLKTGLIFTISDEYIIDEIDENKKILRKELTKIIDETEDGKKFL